MAKRTVEEGYFGSLGLGDPMSTFAEKTIRAAWDFSKKNVPENKTIPLMQIPKGFCIDRISVVQTKYTEQAVTLTFGLASDNSYTVGGNFALVDTGTKLRASLDADTTIHAARFVTDDDMLCMIVPDGLTDDELVDGAFDVCVHGFSTFAEGPAANVTGNDVFRKSLQTTDNVSGGQFPLD